MRYYKQINNGYILSVGTGNGGDEITEIEYNEILAVIRTKPADTETIGYRLKTDLTWEEYPIEPPDPDPGPDIDTVEGFLDAVLTDGIVNLPEENDPDYLNENEPEPNYFN